MRSLNGRAEAVRSASPMVFSDNARTRFYYKMRGFRMFSANEISVNPSWFQSDRPVSRALNKSEQFNKLQWANCPCQHCDRRQTCTDTSCFLYSAYKKGDTVPVTLVQKINAARII